MQLRKSFYRSLFTLPFLFGGIVPLQAMTITPNITTDPDIGADAANCSLRYAIESINNGVLEPGCTNFSTGIPGTDDTVILGPNTYVLTINGNDSGNQSGDLDVSHVEIVLTGAGSGSTTIDASGIPDKDRVLEFDDAPSATITGITFTGGDVSGLNQNGGAILCNAGTLTLTDVFIVQNRAAFGGGIAMESQGPTLILDNSTIDHNFGAAGTNGGCGGGIWSTNGTTVSIQNSTISNNQAIDGAGGGICDTGDFLFLTNSTVSTNTATDVGGGIATAGGLKGAYNVTIAFNSTQDAGGGVFRDLPPIQPDGRFPTQIFNTIIAKNTAVVEGNDCSGTFGSGGNNLIGDIGAPDVCNTFTNGVSGDQVGTTAAPIDPRLGPLQFNGGGTSGQTHALLTGSPAIDKGNANGCRALDVANFDPDPLTPLTFVDLTTDQRLLTRPVAILDPNTPICDIGAFEVQQINFALTKDDGLNGSIPVGQTFTYTIVATNNGTSDAIGVTLSDPLPAQVNYVSSTTSQGTCSAAADVVSCDLGNIAQGASVTVTVTVTADLEGTAVNTATLTIPPQDTLQASVTTVITGGAFLFEGSGCSLNPRAETSALSLSGVLLLALVTALMYGNFRRKAEGRGV